MLRTTQSSEQWSRCTPTISKPFNREGGIITEGNGLNLRWLIGILTWKKGRARRYYSTYLWSS